jgi:hemoglobin/transferrin/lactoferrin receptor protein
VARNTRLSTLDLEDRRSGATRTRSSIQSFFRNGATARGWVTPGADGTSGTADDLLSATGETLAQVQARVLGAGVTSAPLFNELPGFVTFGLRGGIRLGVHEVIVSAENLADRTYRGVSWGLDGPGRSVAVRYQFRF